jgi:RNA recognition motif-containing protein
MNIFVAKLNYDTDEDTLRSTFEEYGTVDSAKVVMDKFTGRSKGFGFVEMPDDAQGSAAINGLNDTELDGRTIVVKKAEPKPDGGGRDFRGGNDRRGGGGFRNGGDRRY